MNVRYEAAVRALRSLRAGKRLVIRALVPMFLTAIACASSGCLVLSVNPGFDDTTIAWDPKLTGTWIDAEDNASLVVDRGEWNSYRIRYVHPIETGDLTGYLTIIGNERYLDVMPVRGADRGSFLIPVHALLRLRLDGDRLELTPLSYDWFFDRMRSGKPLAGLHVAFDQKENALVLSPVAEWRDWVRIQSADSPVFGAAATFTRKVGPR